MTPQQLLEEVKGRFIILFHSDESALTALLRQSLGKFQEKAGIIFSVSAESATIPLPPDYWRTAMVHDAKCGTSRHASTGKPMKFSSTLIPETYRPTLCITSSAYGTPRTILSTPASPTCLSGMPAARQCTRTPRSRKKNRSNDTLSCVSSTKYVLEAWPASCALSIS